MGVWSAPEGIFTIEEFKRLPLEGRRWELLDGKVVQMEPHGLDTSAITASLLGLIGNHVHKSDLGLVLDAGCGYRCWPGHKTVRVTDGSFTRLEVIPADRDRHDFPRWAPELIVEVFSPFEHMGTVIGRIAMFLKAGTRLTWLVGSSSKTVTIISQETIVASLGLQDTLDGGDVLQGFRVPVAEIFA